jgi:hypothetical protein
MSMIFSPASVYGLWSIYALSSLIYVIAYIRWTVNCGKWYTKLDSKDPKIAKRATFQAARNSTFISVMFRITIVLFGIAIIVNILAVENAHVWDVLAVIVAPWVIAAICRIFIERQAKNRDTYASLLLPHKMAIAASLRKDGYEDGAFKSE